MKKLFFSILIDAPKEVVYSKMIELESYKIWTAPFCEGSYYEGSWNANEKMRFLSPENGGMIAEIAVNQPNEYISIRHLGFINNGIEDTESEKVRSMFPAYENYTFETKDKFTELKIDLDMTEEFEQYMNEAWPKALSQLKEICEA
jgi:hypothetical protein